MSDDPMDIKVLDDKKSKASKPADDMSAGQPAQPSGTDKYGRQLYKAVCAGCGGEAMVPFQPTSGRPVYCQNCYKPRPRRDFGGGSNDRGGGRSFGGGRHH